MDQKAIFKQALEKLGEVQRQLSGVVGSSDDWRRELIRLRLELQKQVDIISRALEQGAGLGLDPAEERRVRSGLSAMRSALALHQANWSAVKIDQDDPDYQASGAAVRKSNLNFLAMVGEIMATSDR